jgi:flagellar basal-body rod modification protein FlgD
MTISSIPNSSVASTLSTLGTTTGSASGTSSASNTASTATSSLSQLGSQSYFLQLLVAQMNNQDPLNPMDSAQVTSQLAQINTVSGIQTLSTQLTSLLASSTAGQSSLVGQQVLVPGTTLNLPAGGSAHGGVGLATAATQVSITIKNASGQVVDTMNLGAEPAGTTNFTWDGTTSSGATAPAGQYTYSVAATAAGQSVTATQYAAGLVTSISPTATGTNVNVAGLGAYSISQIQQIQ